MKLLVALGTPGAVSSRPFTAKGLPMAVEVKAIAMAIGNVDLIFKVLLKSVLAETVCNKREMM